MRLPMAAHRTTYRDDADALVRLVFGLTIAVGAVATVMIAATGDVPLIGLPTLVLLGWLVAGASVAGAAWAAAAVWLVLAPIAYGEGAAGAIGDGSPLPRHRARAGASAHMVGAGCRAPVRCPRFARRELDRRGRGRPHRLIPRRWTRVSPGEHYGPESGGCHDS